MCRKRKESVVYNTTTRVLKKFAIYASQLVTLFKI